MKKFWTNGAMIFAGVVSIPAIVTSVDKIAAPSAGLPAFRADPRLPLLQRFFDAAAAPVRDYSHLFLSEADRYDLDWRLLPSICFVETTGGKTARNNNLFGWDCGRAEFISIGQAIHTVAYKLAHLPYYKDKDLDELLWAYNPNPEYSEKVKSVMARIARVEISAE